MAACRSLQHLFDKPLPENPLASWTPIKSMKSTDNGSFAELFGELHFQENHPAESSSPPSSVSSSSSSFSDSNSHKLGGIESLLRDNSEKSKTPFAPTCYYPTISSQNKQYRHGHSFSSMSSEGLSHCTEGLGFESSDEVEEFGNDSISLDWRQRREEKHGANVVQERSEYMYCDHRKSRVHRGSFPPPISCIGSNGKPFVNLKSYRENGRFILREIRIPQQEFLRASRENGRLKLQLVHSDDEIDHDEDFDLQDIMEVDEDRKEESSINDDDEEEEEFHETNNVDDTEQDQIKNAMEDN